MNKLSAEFQHFVIKLMIENEAFCQRCSSYLESDYFQSKYLSWFFLKGKEYFEKHKLTPSPHVYLDQLKLIEKDQQPFYAETLSKVLASSDRDRQYVIDELELWIQSSEFKKLHIKTAELYNLGEFDRAFVETKERIEKIFKIKLKEDDYVTPKEVDDILNKVSSGEDVEEVDIMGGGFPNYDNNPTWNGKIPKQGVTTVMGSWNAGKTTFKINCLYHAIKSGAKVLFVFHEGRRSSLVLKIISRFTNIPFNALKTGLLNEEDRVKIEEVKKLFGSVLRVKEFIKVGNTIEELITYCRSIREEFKFDLLVDDYAGKLTVKRPYRELRHNLEEVWNKLDQVAHELNIAVLTGAQTNRDGSASNKKGLSILRSEHLSETIAPAKVSEVVLTLNRSSTDRTEDELIICLDKGRECPDGLLIKCNTSFTRMVTHDIRYGMEVIGFDTSDGRKP